MVTFFGMANTTVQLNTDDRLRGRLMSVYTSTFGSLFAGTPAHWLKAPLTFTVSGIISGVVFLIVIMHRSKILAWQKE